jgi:hypothetical protein
LASELPAAGLQTLQFTSPIPVTNLKKVKTMKKALLTLLAATLLFACKDKKEEVKPDETPAATPWNAYFKMDGNLNDSTNTLTGTATDITFGAKTASFNGTTSFATIPAEGTVTIPEQFSFSFFFKANYTDTRLKPRLVQLLDDKGHSIDVYIENSRVTATNWDEVQRKNLAEFVTSNSPDLTKWHKVVVAIDFKASEMNLYVDDQLAQTVRKGALIKLGKAKIILGRHEHLGAHAMDYYNGELDNLRLYESVVAPSLFPQIVR